MNPTQAKLALNRPLVFGDQSQIEAVAVMEQVNQAVKAILKCEHDYNPSYEPKHACSCIFHFPFEILRAAVTDPRLQLEQQYHRKWIERNCN